jgi:four helix bundle protein
MGVAEEEADETLYWLELLVDTGMAERCAVQRLITEAMELVAILSASRKTARRGGREERGVRAVEG